MAEEQQSMNYMFQDLDGKRSSIQVYKITCTVAGGWVGEKEGREESREGGRQERGIS